MDIKKARILLRARLYIFYFLAAAAFLALWRFHITHSGPAMQSDETAPETIPNAIGMAKVRRVESPNSSETATIVITATKVVREVITFLLRFQPQA